MNKRKRTFILGDWWPAFITGLLVALCFIPMSITASAQELEKLNDSTISISLDYSLAFLGVLITLYALIQVFIKEDWFIYKVKETEYWDEFKTNLLRVMKLLFFIFLFSFIANGLLPFLENLGNTNILYKYLAKLPRILSPSLGFLIGCSSYRIYKTAKIIIIMAGHK